MADKFLAPQDCVVVGNYPDYGCLVCLVAAVTLEVTVRIDSTSCFIIAGNMVLSRKNR